MSIEIWEHSGIKIQGLSLSGVRTCLTLPQYSLAFDVANGLHQAVGMSTFLISHGHMDHASGIPYIISQKAMNSHRPPRFIMPHAMMTPMKEIMNQWSRIEGHDYDFDFIGAAPGDELSLKSNLIIKPFPTIHRIPSLGYSIYRKFRKLRNDLVGFSGEEIAKVRERGEDPTEERLELLVSFTGDTQIEFLDNAPEVAKSKILIMETTYLDERKPIKSAKEWGHTHLREIIPRLHEIKSEKILLIHSSARYSLQEAQEILHNQPPEYERARVTLFGGR